MLEVSLRAVAREFLEDSQWNTAKALEQFEARLEKDHSLRALVIHAAASAALREVSSQQRTKLRTLSSREVGVDETR